ncbi:MAG: Bacterial membrane protein YfhO [Chloroflexi bacterium ADurb.Bin325]|nr:MAG: Bacterial membrane protein YfhO [Chloroflexi bacterium ADurb.Bin325]
MSGPRMPRPRGCGADLAAWLALALATLVVLWPLGTTNRILAGVDAFTYFDPYWDYRMAALAAGQLPLWNPYLFLGVPFLANPQAAVLYPLHWPLSWLSSQAALVWSALLHVWLAAGFTYTLARRSFRLTRPAAWLAGALFALGGFTLARVENINQLNALAWFPALLWLYDETARAASWRGRVRWGVALSIAIALQLLAGHTQTTFINMVGLGLYALARGARPSTAAALLRRLVAALAPLLAILPALALSAAQLLPTLELNALGLRTGGLPYRQAASFSLRPRLLAQTLLPPYGGGLAEAFASEGYAEFAGYVGIVGLLLAGWALAHALRACRLRLPRLHVSLRDTLRSGCLRYSENAESTLSEGRRCATSAVEGAALTPAPSTGLSSSAASSRTTRSGCSASDSGSVVGPALLAAIGLFLALGAYNPAYYLLWRIVPGFDLFRAPARWLELYALGVALLAGRGLDALPLPPRAPRLGRYILRRAALIFLVLAGAVLLASQQMPPLATIGGWLAALLLVTALMWAARRWPRAASAGLLMLALAELWVAGRSLPFVQATAPLAAGLRNAPAALLAATAGQPPAGRDRFLSLSDIRFDPGDLAALRKLQADRLPADAVERMVRAAKQTEVIAPNLPLRFRLPAVDGYDGGLLPLGRYVQLQSLFLPPESLVPDGRLREQLQHIPPDRLLDLTGVRFVVTDKQHDLWADDVYYDLEHPAALAPGATLELDLAGYPPFSATGLGLVVDAAGDAARGTVGVAARGTNVTLPFIARPADGDGPAIPLRLDFPAALAPARLTVAADAAGPGLTLRGLSLIDARTATHTSITVSPRGNFRRIHSGDVKVYERIDAPGRAWLVHAAAPAADDEAALVALADPAFDPRARAILSDAAAPPGLSAGPDAGARAGESVTVVSYAAERVALRADVAAPALLVLADAFYPGWQATVDGAPAAILRANLMLRAVALSPGQHDVILTYRPASWQRGSRASLVALGGLLALLAASFRRRPVL